MELLGNENIPSTPWPQSSAQQCTEDLQGPSMPAMVAPQPTVEIKKSIFPMQMVPQPNQTLQCSGSAQMVPDLQGPLSQGSNMPMITQQQWCASNLQGRTVPIQMASELQNSNAVDSGMPETQPSATRPPGSKPGELRRSPRKNQKPVMLADEIPDDNGKVALLKQYPNVKVDAKQLRAAKKAAVNIGGDKASYKLSSKIVKQLFTTQELANSRGLGLRGKKDTSNVRLPLDEC
ncbi:uncharacterized protein LOC128550061 [Mercenaria mercenaria]|uniref:uncharacterized protein LOC128550061 n=1 Tax=Mercenaria mercenaria TaxID=6596 RepID=UPI00234EC977|nr:uncharacterized protein LOC128550061 [Mercenaria mercenaria]